MTAIPAGYGLALGNFPAGRLLLTLTLVVMIMPAAALVLPIFLELNALHLIGSALSVILPFSFFPFGVYLAYIYYSTARPARAARRGARRRLREWATFRHIALPLAKPVVALVCFFSFVSDWNNFFLPYACSRTQRSTRSRWGCRPCCRRRRRSTPDRWRRSAGGHLPARARTGHAARGGPGARSSSCCRSAPWSRGLVGGGVKE